jgi:hypothetical protein
MSAVGEIVFEKILSGELHRASREGVLHAMHRRMLAILDLIQSFNRPAR